MWQQLHAQWQHEQRMASLSHAAASALYCKAALDPAEQRSKGKAALDPAEQRGKAGASAALGAMVTAMIDEARQKAALLGVMEAAYWVTAMAGSVQPYGAWLDDGGPVDYVEAIVGGLLDEFCYVEDDDGEDD
jgi:hypothetical protein